MTSRITTNPREMQDKRNHQVAQHPDHDTPAATNLQPASRRKNTPDVARMAYSKAEAAASLGVSVDFLEAHVLADLRVVRKGRLVLIPVAELERWLDRSAASLWGRAA